MKGKSALNKVRISPIASNHLFKKFFILPLSKQFALRHV